jgi:hypothetical protein
VNKKIWYIAYPTGGRPYLYLLITENGRYKCRGSIVLLPEASLEDCVRRLEANLGV